MGRSSAWIDILEVFSTICSIGGGCGGCFGVEGGSGDIFGWSSTTGGCIALLGGSGGVGSLAFKAPDRGPVSPARIFEVDVLDFLDVGRGKPSSSSSSSLGISRLMGPLHPSGLEALRPAWSLMIARVELMADFQRARGLKFSRRPGRSVSVDGVWIVSHWVVSASQGGTGKQNTHVIGESASRGWPFSGIRIQQQLDKVLG